MDGVFVELIYEMNAFDTFKSNAGANIWSRCREARTINAKQIMSHVHCEDHVDWIRVAKLKGKDFTITI